MSDETRDRQLSDERSPGRMRIDRLCDEFEAEFRDGVPSLEAYLSRGETEDQAELLTELLNIELELKRAGPEFKTVRDYLIRFPSHADLIMRLFAERESTSDPAKHGAEDRQTSSPDTRFRILKSLGRGGSGEVFLARDDQLGRDVALKQLRPHLADDAEQRQSLIIEAGITGTLEHPGIVPVYVSSRRSNGEPFYAMRLVKGERLDEVIENWHSSEPWKLPTHEVRKQLRPLIEHLIAACNTVAFAHRHGVIHCDLKPHHITLGEFGETWVLDWGLACRRGDDVIEVRHSSRGTPGYVSPEQLAGDPTAIGPAVDVYSLGATLYHLLTGRPAFTKEPEATFVHRVTHAEFQAPRSLFPQIPRDLEAICLKAMATLPSDRYSSALAFVDDLRDWVAGEPVSAYRDPWAKRFIRWCSRRKTVVVATVAAGSVGLAVAGIITFRSAVSRARHVDGILELLPAQSPNNVSGLRKVTEPYHDLLDPELTRLRKKATTLPQTKLIAALVLPPDDARSSESFDVLMQTELNELGPCLAHFRKSPGDLIPRFEKLLDDQTQLTAERFKAGIILAGLIEPLDAAAGRSRIWHKRGVFLARQFHQQSQTNHTWASAIAERLKPIREAMFQPLMANIRGVVVEEKDWEATQSRASNLLEILFPNNPEVMAELILTDETKDTYLRHLETLTHAPERVIDTLERKITRPVNRWPDPVIEPEWKQPDDATVALIEAAHGLIHPQFALVQSLPFEKFESLAESLRPCGYRPIKVRPYLNSADALCIAATWFRDGHQWQMALRSTFEEIERENRNHQVTNDGFSLVDYAGYQTPLPEPRYLAIWSDDTLTMEQRRDARYRSVEVDGDIECLLWPSRTLGGAPRYTPVPMTKEPVACDLVNLRTRQSFRHRDGSVSWTSVLTDEPSDNDGPPPSFYGDEQQYLHQLSSGGMQIDIAINFDDKGVLHYGATYLSNYQGFFVATTEVHGLSLEAHTLRFRELANEGKWPIAIAVATPESGKPETTASVWHLPEHTGTPATSPALMQASAAVTLLNLGYDRFVWQLLKRSSDPIVRSYLIDRLSRYLVNPNRLVARLNEEKEEGIRSALMLTLGNIKPNSLSEPSQALVISLALDAYRTDADPGVHGAATYLLDKWRRSGERKVLNAAIKGKPPEEGRLWYVNSLDQTMVVANTSPVEFFMGGSSTHLGREKERLRHRKRIDRRFAIAATEVTWKQFLEFFAECGEAQKLKLPGRSHITTSDDCPITGLTVYTAARFCNWLSRKESLPEYYPGIEKLRDREDYVPPEGSHLGTGYRLPTEAEWEFSERGGTESDRYYGTDTNARTCLLLSRYAWFADNSKGKTNEVGLLLPNDLGCFDMLGNVQELCIDRFDRVVRFNPTNSDSLRYGPIDPFSNRVRRGGWIVNGEDGIAGNLPSWNWAVYPDQENGLRLTRTLELMDSKDAK